MKAASEPERDVARVCFIRWKYNMEDSFNPRAPLSPPMAETIARVSASLDLGGRLGEGISEEKAARVKQVMADAALIFTHIAEGRAEGSEMMILGGLGDWGFSQRSIDSVSLHLVPDRKGKVDAVEFVRAFLSSREMIESPGFKRGSPPQRVKEGYRIAPWSPCPLGGTEGEADGVQGEQTPVSGVGEEEDPGMEPALLPRWSDHATTPSKMPLTARAQCALDKLHEYLNPRQRGWLDPGPVIEFGWDMIHALTPGDTANPAAEDQAKRASQTLVTLKTIAGHGGPKGIVSPEVVVSFFDSFLVEWIALVPHKQGRFIGVLAFKSIIRELDIPIQDMEKRFPAPPKGPTQLPPRPHWLQEEDCIEFVLERRLGAISQEASTGEGRGLQAAFGKSPAPLQGLGGGNSIPKESLPGIRGGFQIGAPLQLTPEQIRNLEEEAEEVKPVSLNAASTAAKFGMKLKGLGRKSKLPPLSKADLDAFEEIKPTPIGTVVMGAMGAKSFGGKLKALGAKRASNAPGA